MNAIILAAGIGSRLRPLTDSRPKTMVKVNGTPMIGHIIRALLADRVARIVICTGYRAEIIKDYCAREFPGAPITFVDNPDFTTTNNMFSLYLAREYLHGDCFLMNADLRFDPEIIPLLRSQPGSAFAVDKARYIEESMKVVVNGRRVTAIAKTIKPEESYGCSIDVYKISAADAPLLIEEMRRIIDLEGNRNQWTELMLHRLCADGRLTVTPADIGKLRWYEIDNFEDLAVAELLFNENLAELRRRSVFFLDRDGTLTLEAKPLNGASDFLSWLRERGAAPFLLTNNSSKTPLEHHAALARSGLEFRTEELLLSTDVAARFLKEAGLVRIHWVASEKVGRHLTEVHGLQFASEKPQAVLLTYDDTVTYAKLVEATRHLQQGVRYFATHCDVVCPTTEGPVPDIGTMLETLRLTTGRTPELVFGKPDVRMVEGTLKALGKSFADAVVIGDRLYTDIALAAGNDMLSVLVLSGETTRAQYEDSPYRADIVVPHLGSLVTIFKVKP